MVRQIECDACLHINKTFTRGAVVIFPEKAHIYCRKLYNVTFSVMLCVLSYPTHKSPSTMYGTLSVVRMCSVTFFALISAQI